MGLYEALVQRSEEKGKVILDLVSQLQGEKLLISDIHGRLPDFSFIDKLLLPREEILPLGCDISFGALEPKRPVRDFLKPYMFAGSVEVGNYINSPEFFIKAEQHGDSRLARRFADVVQEYCSDLDLECRFEIGDEKEAQDSIYQRPLMIPKPYVKN